MDRQSVVCQKCSGVLLATDSRTYTAQRGRLILTNGYCTCPAEQAPVEQVVQRQQHPQHPQPVMEQPVSHRQPTHSQQQGAPAGQNSMVVA
ncbi:hypothetical protein [Streptosporangium sp. NPDC002524]|uniref:hypothetical protein n=1 Tax=Streptosporangium sp. NPDC002524 TaxID=3154537 RepID=UPI00331C89BB